MFECATPTGNQCLLVRGLGAEQNCKFERFVFDGTFDLGDFTEDSGNGTSVVVDFDMLRARLAGRDLTKVKSGQLWEVLASKAYKTNKEFPRLGILPIREKSEYNSFRDVYVRLLALSNANAKQLRNLLVKCYAREIGEKQIDVATEYQEPFDRAERTEREVKFLKSVADLIDQAQVCTDKIGDFHLTIESELPEIVRFLTRVLTESRTVVANVETERSELSSRRIELDESIEKLRTDLVDAKVELDKHSEKEAHLNSLHEKWSSTSPEMIQVTKSSQSKMTSQIGKLKVLLDDTEEVSLDSIEREEKRLRGEAERLKLSVENWGESFGSFLLQQGVSRKELDSVFRLFNSDTLHLSLNDSVQVTNDRELIERLKAIAMRFKKSVYSDDLLRVNLSSINPSTEELENRDLLLERLTLAEAALAQSLAKFDAVKDREAKKTQLFELQVKWRNFENDLNEYERYRDEWENRSRLKKQVDDQTKACDVIESAIKENGKSLKLIATTDKRLAGDLSKCEEMQRSISLQLGELRGKVPSFADGLWPLDDATDADEDKSPVLRSIQKRLVKIEPRVQNLLQQFSAISELQNQLQKLSHKVESKSSEVDGQRVYFSDFVEQWNELFDRRAKLDELEGIAKRQWKLLFVPLSARLNDMLVAFRNVQNAVSALNRRLAKHRVSNLRSLRVSVKPEVSTFAVVETLGSQDSLFNDPDQEEFARQRLRRMIDDGQVIDLENMFFLKIEAEESTGNQIVSKSLDEIGSTGTGTTAKTMIFVSLVRAIASDNNYKLHFYIDEIGDLDDPNLEAVTSMAVEQGVLPITANPHVKLEPLAHPDVTNYALGLSEDGLFIVDEGRTYRARRKTQSQSRNGPVDAAESPESETIAK